MQDRIIIVGSANTAPYLRQAIERVAAEHGAAVVFTDIPSAAYVELPKPKDVLIFCKAPSFPEINTIPRKQTYEDRAKPNQPWCAK